MQVVQQRPWQPEERLAVPAGNRAHACMFIIVTTKNILCRHLETVCTYYATEKQSRLLQLAKLVSGLQHACYCDCMLLRSNTGGQAAAC